MESLKPARQVTGLNKYVFIVRHGVSWYINATSPFLVDCVSLDKKFKVTTCYVDVKLKLRRDLLRDVLKDVRKISLNESKLSVSYTVAILRSATYLGQDQAERAIHHLS